jgi:hypothetical protein
MYSLTIHFGPNAMTWMFLFKEKENASAGWKNIVGDSLDITDDFGQRAVIKLNSIHGSVLEDLDLTEEARIYRSLANARGEVKARQRAATDPVLRTAQNGPAVISPNFRQ